MRKSVGEIRHAKRTRFETSREMFPRSLSWKGIEEFDLIVNYLKSFRHTRLLSPHRRCEIPQLPEKPGIGKLPIVIFFLLKKK